jgi:hypothetical protein
LLLAGIDNAWATLAEAKSFSNINLHSGYWQVTQRSEDKERTTSTMGQRLWKFTAMPFVGFCNETF